MIKINKIRNYLFEIELVSNPELDNPFWDIEIKATFLHKEKNIELTVYGFYDGYNCNNEHVWKIRWRPVEPGLWNCKIVSYPDDELINYETLLNINADETDKKGTLCINHKSKWKFCLETGEPCYLLGDTMYNLFGAYYCGVDIHQILRKRRSQGVNYLRTRIHVSPFHQPIQNSWQGKSCWPWGGSAQWPDFKRFNLDYFRHVDEAMILLSDMDYGIELILEAWMMEFPFNDRAKFIPEYEELWIRYIISRYSAFKCVYIWCPANEYEFYPDGAARYHTEADRWIKRISALIKTYDPYKHPVGVHNWGENEIPLTKRMKNTRDIDVYLVQTAWVNNLKNPDVDIELCPYLEEQVHNLVPDDDRAVIVSEFGYETAKDLSTVDVHDNLNCHHTRRGQWRAAFAGYPAVHGFNNTWGPHMTITPDAEGAEYLIHLYKFMTEEVKFYEMGPNNNLLISKSGIKGETMPVCLSNDTNTTIAVYFPVRGYCKINLPGAGGFVYCWFNPRTGSKTEFTECQSDRFETPESDERDDWVLLILKNSGNN